VFRFFSLSCWRGVCVGVPLFDAYTAVEEYLTHSAATQMEDFGEITAQQMLSIESKLTDIKGYYTVIALFHHHFYLFPEVFEKHGDSSLIKNHTDFSAHLRNINAKVVLHGHKHFDLEAPFSFYNYGTIDVVAGGSLNFRGIDNHSFSVIDIHHRNDRVRVTVGKFAYRRALFNYDKIFLPPQITLTLPSIYDLLGTDSITRYYGLMPKLLKSLSHLNTLQWVEKFFMQLPIDSPIISRIKQMNYLSHLVFLCVGYRGLCYVDKVAATDYHDSLKSEIKSLLSLSDEEITQLLSAIASRSIIDSALTMNSLFDASSEYFKELVSLCSLSIYLTDIYLALTQSSNQFKNSIRHKSNVNIDDVNFPKHISHNNLFLLFDNNKRRMNIIIECDDANAHKYAALLVNEFELVLSGFERLFAHVGIKLYYVRAQISAFGADTVSNHNFEAYTPTIMPLLAGGHLYSTDLVFVRELVQNCIDAINIRAIISDGSTEPIKIELSLNNTDDESISVFRIIDKGIGMGSSEIERYLTSIGRSFYSPDELRQMDITYIPISMFGIGFLSAFLIGKNVTVRTKKIVEAGEDQSRNIILSIPNIEGCFFAEDSKDNFESGTDIEVCLTNRTVSLGEILEYIDKTLLDIHHDINIVWDKGFEYALLVPYSEDGQTIDVRATHLAEIAKKTHTNTRDERFSFYPLQNGLIVKSDCSHSFGTEWWNRNLKKKLGNISLSHVQNLSNYQIRKHSIRKTGRKYFIFIPFCENGTILNIDCITEEEMNSYPYGIFISDQPMAGRIVRNKNEGLSICSGSFTLLNAGISIEQADIQQFFGKDFEMYTHEDELAYNDIVINFPPNWLKLDISRERIKEFSDLISKKAFAKSLASAMVSPLERLRDSENHCIELVHLYQLVSVLIKIGDDTFHQNELTDIRESLQMSRSSLDIIFENDCIKFKMINGDTKKDMKKLFEESASYRGEIIYNIDAELGSEEWKNFIHQNDFLKKVADVMSQTKDRIDSISALDQRLKNMFKQTEHITDDSGDLYHFTSLMFALYLVIFNKTDKISLATASRCWYSIERQFMRHFTTSDMQDGNALERISLDLMVKFIDHYVSEETDMESDYITDPEGLL